MQITIRHLKTNAEFTEAVELQKIVWRLNDYSDCVPVHMFVAVSETGGVALGAYHDDVMVGFLMAIAAYSEKTGMYHHSHILGILPGYANKKIGFSLKKEHYKIALKAGVKKVTWTYDPILGANANLNISKLGGIVREYKVDYYGEVMGGSELVSGMPSDRFLVEWYIDTERVRARMEGLQVYKPGLMATEENIINVDNVDKFDLSKYHGGELFFEIPADFQAAYDNNKESALEIRLKSRDIFLRFFSEEFIVTDFIHSPEGFEDRNFYILKYKTKYLEEGNIL